MNSRNWSKATSGTIVAAPRGLSMIFRKVLRHLRLFCTRTREQSNTIVSFENGTESEDKFHSLRDRSCSMLLCTMPVACTSMARFNRYKYFTVVEVVSTHVLPKEEYELCADWRKCYLLYHIHIAY